MIQDSKERADHWKALRARLAEPDLTPVQFGQRTFVRNLGKRCPICGQVFFAFQELGQEREPYRVDPEPEPGRSLIGARETCGYPGCLEDEQQHQLKRRIFFAGAAKAQGEAS